MAHRARYPLWVTERRRAVGYVERKPLVTPQVFEPEAQRTLAGGGAQRNHRKRRKSRAAPWKGAGPGLALLCIPVRRPCRDAKSVLSNSGGYAALHHRLISGVPPGRKRISRLVWKPMVHAPHTLSNSQKSNFNPTRIVRGLIVRRGVRKALRPAAPKSMNSEPKLKTVALKGLNASI